MLITIRNNAASYKKIRSSKPGNGYIIQKVRSQQDEQLKKFFFRGRHSFLGTIYNNNREKQCWRTGHPCADPAESVVR